MDATISFMRIYQTKAELQEECRKKELSANGSKEELYDRLNGKASVQKTKGRDNTPSLITDDTIIEENIRCSEKHRAYFESRLGRSFTFKVQFQRWLKDNHGKTYLDAVHAYRDVCKAKPDAGPQFEYNAYIREFFSETEGLTLSDAIKCWKHKKKKCLHPLFEQEDLSVLKGE